MKDNYAVIVEQNLEKLYSNLPEDLALNLPEDLALNLPEDLALNLSEDPVLNLPGEKKSRSFEFQAFGRACTLSRKKIKLSPLPLQSLPDTRSLSNAINTHHSKSNHDTQLNEHASLLGILISLYALHACSDTCILTPFKAFKEFSGTMPFVGAFTTHTEHLLLPKVIDIKNRLYDIKALLRGEDAPAGTNGDFAFVVYPLPKIALCYIFYEADEDFDASVTCLFSYNADRFISIDGLADVGEYTSRTILKIIAS